MAEHKDKFLRHEACPRCGSSDGVSVYKSGLKYCEIEKKPLRDDDLPIIKEDVPEATRSAVFLPVEIKSIPKRGLTEQICTRYGYGYATDPKWGRVQVAQYQTSGVITAQHLRTPKKDFPWIGDTDNIELFGQHLFRTGGKRIWITEGEIDCMTVAQVLEKWPVVSLPNGAQSAKRYLQKHLEWLESYDEIVLVFDNDEPDKLGHRAGQEALAECALLFTPGKVHTISIPYKDPNAMLMAGKRDELYKALWETKVYRPDGIVSASEISLSSLQHGKKITSYPIPYPELNAMLRGWRKRELTILTAGSGMGKSILAKHFAKDLVDQGLRVGYVALEESNEKTFIGLMAIKYGIPMGDLFLNRELLTDEQWSEGYAYFTRDSNLFLYDHWGSLDTANLVSKLRYMATGCSVDFIFLDHISIVVSGISEGDERRLIDNLMTNLRSLVENTGAGVIAISHLRVPERGKPHEEGGRVYMNQLRGSGAIKQLSDNIIALEGNQQGDQPHLRQARLLKNRLFGTLGLADTLAYDEKTGLILSTDIKYEIEKEKDF